MMRSSFLHKIGHGLLKKLRQQATLWLLFQLLFLAVQGASPLRPDKLTCEYLSNPLGLDVEKPRFSWTLVSPERAAAQRAYELIVSDDSAFIKKGKGTTWASAKVVASQSLHVLYSGKPLQPFTRYYWRVRVWDEKGRLSAWSEPAHFETAMLQASDWKAHWIGDGRAQFEHDSLFYQDDPMPLFRKEFSAGKKIATARLYISGQGYYEAYLNGKKISDHLLAPGFATFKKQVLYQTHDVTDLVANGQNVIGVMLGNGWWNPLPLRLFGRFNLRNVQQTGRPCVKAQLLVRYTDGTSDWIVTDESWKTTKGPVIRNNVYLGEVYDARLEVESWSKGIGDMGIWKSAVKVEGPSGMLVAQTFPPVRITDVIKPIGIKETGKDTFIVDLGQNFAGVARIRVRGEKGRKISLRYGEALHGDGRLNYFTTVAGQIKEIWNLRGGPGAPKTAWQQDAYILRGNGIETWAPRFTFHGFRYVEITGWPGTPTVDDIEGLRMHTDVDPVGTFACSDTLFNQLHDIIKRTFLSNLFSVQSDCPGREKMGYGADIVVTSEAFSYNYDMAGFYRKTVQDFANDQQPDGGITEVAPYTGIADRGYGGESGPLGWQLAFPYLQKKLYEFYGDKRIIEEQYPAIVKQLRFLQSKAVDHLFYWDISDHEALDTKPEAFTAASFYYHHAVLAAEFAGIVAKKDDSVRYAKLAEHIKNAIRRRYDIPGTGRFDNATQAAQLFALWYGFTPEPQKSFAVLQDEIARHKGHLSTGIFSTKMLFDVARERDQNEVAYSIAAQRDFPGWGYMLQKGATTLWETWAYPDNAPSQNHPMFGSIDEWFYRSLLGINAAAPGFEKVVIKPQPAGDLTWARGSYQSVRGTIRSAWEKQNNAFILNVSIPANTTAEIWIMASENSTVTEGSKTISTDKNMRLLRREKGYAVVAVGSGDYSFQVQTK
jgi:alpha-L-rhamnosidase